MSKQASCPSKSHLVRPRGRVRCAALLTALAFGGASIELHAAPPAETEAEPEATVRVVVDASALGPKNADYFEQEIGAGLREGLITAGFEVVEEGQSTVRIRLDYYNEDHRDFLIFADVAREGRIAISQRPAKCPICVDSQLIEAALGLLPELVEVLRADAGQLPPAEGSGDPAPSGDGDGDGGVEPPPPAAIGPVGITGGVVAALGVGSVVWGAVALSLGEVYDQDTDTLDLYRTGTDHTPRGQILLGVGLGGVVVGAVMLATDLALRSKRRKQHQEPESGAFAPLLSPDLVGLGWTGRF